MVRLADREVPSWAPLDPYRYYAHSYWYTDEAVDAGDEIRKDWYADADGGLNAHLVDIPL